MDVVTFLKMVPAVLGAAGLLSYAFRKRAPVSDRDLVNTVQSAWTTLVVLTCAALIGLTLWLIFRPPPLDHDAALPGDRSALVKPVMQAADFGTPYWG